MAHTYHYSLYKGVPRRIFWNTNIAVRFEVNAQKLMMGFV